MEIPDKPIKKEKEASEEIERLILDLKDEDNDVRWGGRMDTWEYEGCKGC